MSKHKLEYIWLDGYKPTQSLRGKTMIVEDFSGKVEDAKQWSFDGSSTEQAEEDLQIVSYSQFVSLRILIVSAEMVG